MKSGWPVLLGIVGLVGGAFWFDAHSERVAEAASAWVAPAAPDLPVAPAAPDVPAAPSAPAAPSDDATPTSTESTVALGSANESK